jgi:hypothetical protein
LPWSSAPWFATWSSRSIRGQLTRGRRVMIPAQSVGYVEIGSEEQRKVGFGSL